MIDKCPKGHYYDKWNTYLLTDKNGIRRRYCRACRRNKNRKVRIDRQKAVYEARFRQTLERVKDNLEKEGK